MTIHIREARLSDCPFITELALKLWPDNTYDDLFGSFMEEFDNEASALLIAFADDIVVGFAHGALRVDYVEGAEESPVGYIEGIFVEEEYRRHGVARALVDAIADWAKGKGCAEIASDCELGNEESLTFHKGIGFEEVNRIICFARRIGG